MKICYLLTLLTTLFFSFFLSKSFGSTFELIYYKENGFDNYIENYINQTTNLWNSEYKIVDESNSNESIDQKNELIAHIFKKRKSTKMNELEQYLNKILQIMTQIH